MQGIEETLRKIKEIQQQRNEIDYLIAALEDNVKNEMEADGTDEIRTDLFTARWKEITASRFDSKAFREENAALYARYLRQTVTKRFSIA
jgi:predicted phage-related endonuclease